MSREEARAHQFEVVRKRREEKEAEKSMKQKARAQSRPKMSKMDIDYQVLHDAFFRFQTKPKLTTLACGRACVAKHP
jgi:splicing factor 3B subunit 2